MDYQKHYNALIERARNRRIEGYKEAHHVEPRCVGGSDDRENLVDLTPEEHYVAHQLLVKIYPEEPKLVYAANMMSVSNSYQRRRNKAYGWLKRKLSGILSENQSEIGNSQYGTFWITDGSSSKKIKRSETVPDGWFEGRRIPSRYKKERIFTCVCGLKVSTRRIDQKFCSISCSSRGRKWNHTDSSKKKMSESARNRPNNAKNTIWITNGFQNKRISSDDNIPNSWRRGRVKNARVSPLATN